MSLWTRAKRRAGIEARVAADVVAGGRRLPGTKPQDAALVKYEGRSLWAQTRVSATPSQVHAEILDTVFQALANSGIPAIALTESATSASLAVFAPDAQDVATVLAHLAPDSMWLAHRVGDSCS